MSHQPTPAPAVHVEANGRRIAHVTHPGGAPHVVFLPGFRSDMTGVKALAVENHARARGLGVTRLDYSGHGRSSGRFEEGTIGAWSADALAVVDRATSGPLLLVGSSMGGWIMLLVARARPDRVAGCVGIAAAPDFTEDLIWAVATTEQRAALLDRGVHYEPSAYDEAPTPITRALIEDGRDHLVLRTPLALTCPIHLLHGQRDPDVPWQTALKLAAHVASEDVTVELIKDGEHRLSRARDIRRLLAAVDRLAEEVGR
ncbi:MAG: alpha/beta hydrolase [Alphaproteobacteria bacterium]